MVLHKIARSSNPRGLWVVIGEAEEAENVRRLRGPVVVEPPSPPEVIVGVGCREAFTYTTTAVLRFRVIQTRVQLLLALVPTLCGWVKDENYEVKNRSVSRVQLRAK
ncbi:uncharacterized protein G2W53_028492 [Senna tora]|uniref:Uncharacterized protein n=1 Tax=Senna tora TaxID=362788 RepID=A0A834T117_9FABA|nr:uncharacterized protein G2W53_028492 [Senna tora]